MLPHFCFNLIVRLNVNIVLFLLNKISSYMHIFTIGCIFTSESVAKLITMIEYLSRDHFGSSETLSG